MAPQRPSWCVAALIAFAPWATAQCPESLSFMSGMPTGMSLADDPAVPFDATQVYVTEAGFSQAAPLEWPALGASIHFRLNDILANCTTATLDVNAMSLGQDFLLINDATGVIEIPNNRWAAFNFSVAKTARGSVGSLVEQEAATPDGPGADLFSYAFLGSALPPELMGQAQRTHDSREIDLGDGAVAQREIDAIDQYMPLYRLDPALAATMPPAPTIYFSLSASTVGAAPPFWFSGTPNSSASILRVDWQPSVLSWGCPTLFKPYFDLGLSINDDIDALAIDIERARIVFSTTNLARDQLEFVPCVQDNPTPKPVKETQPDGTEKKVTEKMGLLDDDDVDGVCGIDPSIRRRTGALGTAINTMFYAIGTPTAPVFPPADTLQASAIRVDSPLGPAFYSQIVGWPPVTGQGPGIALLTFSPAGTLNPLFAIDGGFRNDVMPIHCGDPYGVRWLFPPNWVLHMPTLEFDLRWFVANVALTELRDAHPLRIRL
ncbi:MAG: hypothetical protein KDB80_08130 [Planctomycetes bacterium]|nr:hypothetical protein [Planctomycetota bacterium]